MRSIITNTGILSILITFWGTTSASAFLMGNASFLKAKLKNGQSSICGPQKNNLEELNKFSGLLHNVGYFKNVGKREVIRTKESEYEAHLKLSHSERFALMAVGDIQCEKTKNTGTGFITDVEHLTGGRLMQKDVISTASHVLFQNGKYLGPCYFIPYGQENKKQLLTNIESYTKSPGAVDSNDIAFATVNKISNVFGKLKIKFENKYDFKENEAGRKEFINAAFHSGSNQIIVTPYCAADDKSKYNLVEIYKKWGYDFSNFVVTNCGVHPGGSGGPLMQRKNGELEIVGMNSGEVGPQSGHGSFFDIDYDPPKSFNYHIRFDLEAEAKLLEYIGKNSGASS